MGFVIWYQVAFRDAAEAPNLLRASNDVRSGDFALDADITVESWTGAHVGTFAIILNDLPLQHAQQLAQRHRRSARGSGPLLAEIRLGYFDRPDTQAGAVLLGAVTEIHTRVSGDGESITELRGEELAGHNLLHTPYAFDRAGAVGLADLAEDIGRAAKIEVEHDGLSARRENLTRRTDTALDALGGLAEEARVPLAIRGGRAYLASSVSRGAPAEFSPDTNIVSQGRRDEEPADLLAPEPTAPIRYDLTVLGDPTLHVGRPVRITPPGSRSPLPGDFRLESVRHIYDQTRGYVCEVGAVNAEPGPAPARRGGAVGLADRLRGVVRSAAANNPAVDVGDVVSYRPGGTDPGHRTTMRYGQPRPSGMDVADTAPERPSPSVATAIPDDAPQLHDKPVAAPFAWDRCGLVVPVYPGMRALLAHNRGEVNDPVVAGFVWSAAAGHAPPAAEDGDYWLCLPTEVRDGRPAGKGVNDLTDRAGLRAVQARGLSIRVADGDLPDVGARPSVPAELTLEIGHEKGTRIAVAADGAVTIETDGKDITLGNGQAAITITGSSIRLQAQSVEVG